MLRPVLASAVLLLACKGERDERGDLPTAPLTPVRSDAAPPPMPDPVDGGVTTLPTFDPATGFHLDEAPIARPGARPVVRDRKQAQLLLRSTPTGAIAAVDGVILGRTPVLWEGMLDGQRHDFTFAMAGHALARYEFVPVTNGIVHGTLVKITDDRDAGVPEIPRAADAAVPPRPPPPPPPPIDAAPPPPPVDAGSLGAQPGL